MAYECLEMLGEKEIKNWPQVDNSLILKEKIKMAIQINGKTRDIIDVERVMIKFLLKIFAKKTIK